MRTKGWNRKRSALALALATAFVLGSQPAARTADAGPGPNEGIEVHGDWTIDIRNPDGSLASHHEFKNALADGGQSLVGMLTGGSAGGWSIYLGAGPMGGVSPCEGGTGGRAPSCSVIPTNFTPSGNAQFATLTTTRSTSTFTLHGTATALVAGEIGRVSTSVATCLRSESGESCAARVFGGANLFTDKSLSPVIPVAAGQIIQVTVVLSFS